MSRLISQFFCNLNSSKKFTCPLGKLITEFTSPIAKSTSPGLSDTTFFAQWCKRRHLHCQLNLAFTNLMTSWKELIIHVSFQWNGHRIKILQNPQFSKIPKPNFPSPVKQCKLYPPFFELAKTL